MYKSCCLFFHYKSRGRGLGFYLLELVNGPLKSGHAFSHLPWPPLGPLLFCRLQASAAEYVTSPLKVKRLKGNSSGASWVTCVTKQDPGQQTALTNAPADTCIHTDEGENGIFLLFL